MALLRSNRGLVQRPDEEYIKGPNRYRFYPHFHAYTGELTRRLLVPSLTEAAGVPNLQEADTDYAADSIILQNGRHESAVAYRKIPVTLEDGRYALLPFGKSVKLVADGSTKMLSANFLETESVGAAFTTGQSIVADLIVFNPELELPSLPINGVTNIILPTGTRVVLAEWKSTPELYKTIFSRTNYWPTDLVSPPYPVEDLYFNPTGPGSAYSAYNWEIFYHIPIALAIHLSRNQHFEEAKRWFQYVFNPEDDSDGPSPERFWKMRPLQTTDVKSIEDILINLSTNEFTTERKNTIECIRKWMERPFRPHLVARSRPSAYMYKAVMAYLDNLIAWGDSLFRQDRPESVDDAADRYVEAMGILGYRPLPVPRKGSSGPSTYAKLRHANVRGRNFDAFGNILVELESDIPFADVTAEESAGLDAPDSGAGADSNSMEAIRGIGREALYFCIPKNDTLLAYWDTVADRLFKIHNSLNIMGVFRELPLFEPPIDPGLLAKGTAAGLDVSAIAEGLNQPLPLVRFQFLLQKAFEICQEAKSLGDKLLSVIEKEDNEALSILRAQHEKTILDMTEMVKFSQLQESVKSLEGLEKSYDNAVGRFVYYERLLGEKEEDVKTPKLADLESPKDGLNTLKFKSSEPRIEPRIINVDISDDAGGATGGKIKTLNSYEVEDLEKLAKAQRAQDAAGVLDTIAGVMRIIPKIDTALEPLGVGTGLSIGGEDFAAVLQIAAGITRSVGARQSYEAGKSAKLGGYARREQDWISQRNAAAGEINQIIKQYVAAQIRVAVAEKELENHRQQMRHSRQIEDFLLSEKNGKKANKEFYAWMKREVKGIYGQCFRFALETAQKAERALQYELGSGESFLQTGYLAGKEGLLAGERLYADLRKMEMSYHFSSPDLPMEADISLLQIDPAALLRLRATGRCAFSVPETFFDLQCPGFYFRRIRSAAVSLPCVTGPTIGVNCTLTLVNNTIRKSPAVGDGYERLEGLDERLEDNYDVESIVASKGINDSGRLQSDRDARDESQRPPFSGKGVFGLWQVELPADPSKKDPSLFDYGTISDLVLHLQFTARQGGAPLKAKAVESLKTAIEEARMAGSVRLFSLRHDFPVEWYDFKNSVVEFGNHSLEIKLEEKHYPYWAKDRLGSVSKIDIFANQPLGIVGLSASWDSSSETASLEHEVRSQGTMYSTTATWRDSVPPPPSGCKLTFDFSENVLSDLWLAVAWGGNA